MRIDGVCPRILQLLHGRFAGVGAPGGPYLQRTETAGGSSSLRQGRLGLVTQSLRLGEVVNGRVDIAQQLLGLSVDLITLLVAERLTTPVRQKRRTNR